MEDLSYNFIYLRPPYVTTSSSTIHTQLHFMVTPTKDCNLQKKEVYTYIYGSFLQEFKVTCLSRGWLFDFFRQLWTLVINLKRQSHILQYYWFKIGSFQTLITVIHVNTTT